MKTIFIVDDNEADLASVKKALAGSYKICALTSAEKLFQHLEKTAPDLILLDDETPEKDGYQALAALKSDEKNKSIPVVILTAKHDEESEIRGFEMGAVDYINIPFSPPVLKKRIEALIETDKLIKKSMENISKIHNATINIITSLVENRDEITGGHIDRTQRYLGILLNELVRSDVYADEINKWNKEVLLQSAQLHDVGKIKIKEHILSKPAKLSEEEYNSMKNHSIEGEKIIDGIIGKTQEDGFLTHARKFAGCHHEKWDGTGYPRGLAGENIPLEGRIMAIADVYDALVSPRPYKESHTHELAVEIIKNDSGKHFDPKIVEAFLNIADDFWAEMASH
ncbi:MAG: response regulator [Treponema sp.]|nr:response regulator [Treponema sp.]